MRATLDNTYRVALQDLFKLQARQMGVEREISSGVKVSLPSQAPGYSVTIMGSRQIVFEVDQYRSNLEAATTWMSASESALQSLVERLQEARTLAEQMATGTYQSLEHESAASALQGLIDQVISLANSDVDGSYLFGGSRSEDTPITRLLMAQDPAEIWRDSAGGHDTMASYFPPLDQAGLHYLQFSRSSTGLSALLNSLGGDLGQSMGLDFSTWSTLQYAADSPARGQMVYFDQAPVTGANSTISTMAGEELSWLADSGAGDQTFRTEAVLNISGKVSVGVFGSTYEANSASELVNLINQSGDPNYFAWLEGGSTCHVVATGMATVPISDATSPAGNLTIDTSITMDDLVSAINQGQQAHGMLQFDGDGGVFAPDLDNDYITLGDDTWTWREITSGATFANAAGYAQELADFIMAHSDSYTATTVASGNDMVVQISARAVGAGSNVSLVSSYSTITDSNNLWGGLDGNDTSTQGTIYGAGEVLESNQVLGAAIRATVLAVDDATGAVDLRLRWYDDDAQLHTEDVTLAGEGNNSAVEVPGLGGLTIYRDGLDFHEGAVLELSLGHYQGNDEQLGVNFSYGSQHLIHNWSGEEVLGGIRATSLWGVEASSQVSGYSGGGVHLAGVYSGLSDRELTFDIVDGGKLPSDSVTVRVSWTDDEGLPQQVEVALQGAGENNAVVLPVLGGAPSVNLTGDTATQTSSGASGTVHLSGEYHGLTPRQLGFEVTDVDPLSGAVEMTVNWLDDQGLSHQEAVVFDQEGGVVELPGGDGIQLSLEDLGDFTVGDTFTYSRQMYPDQAGDGVFFYLDNGAFTAGDSFYHQIDQSGLHVLDTLNSWLEGLESGDLETAQRSSQLALEQLAEAIAKILDMEGEAGALMDRIEVRAEVMTNYEEYATTTLGELQEVDLTEAFLYLKTQYTAYSASLQVISTMAGLSLVNIL